MANVKISELPAAAAALTSQEFEVNESGTSKKVTGSQIESFVKSNFIASDLKSGGDLTIDDKIVHAGDTDTAIRFPSANTVTVETGGVERMRLTSSQVTFPIATGNLGIEVGSGRSGNGAAFIDLLGDTTYTDYGLRVGREAGGANAPSRFIHRGTGSFEIILNEAAPIRFYTTNLERMRIDSAGNVGIGNTSPTATLTVDGTAGGTIIASQAEAEAGTAANKLMTPERVAQAIDVQQNMVLLGTLTTTSGTAQTLSGLDLTPYISVICFIDGVSHNGGASRELRLNGVSVTPGTTTTASGFYLGQLITMLGVGWTVCLMPSVPNEIDAANTAITTATTSLSFTLNGSGSFDAGKITVYGVR